MSDLIKLFICFLIPGTIGFGGGPAAIAIVNSLVVDTFGLLSQQDMNTIISFSNALPGPIATLLAVGTGVYVYGALGALVALIAMVLPSAVAIILLYNLILNHKNDYRVKRITKYIVPLIIAIFIQISFNFTIQSYLLMNNYIITTLIIILTAVLTKKNIVHPAIIIIFAMVFGYFIL